MFRPLRETHPRLCSWLQNLNDCIWQRHEQTLCSGAKEPWYSDKRVLTSAEYDRVLAVIQSRRVILTLSAPFGFNLAVDIWDYPAHVNEQLVCLAVINNRHIEGMRSGLNGQVGGMWELLHPHTHSECNKQAVDFFKLDPIRERVHYDY